MKPDEREKRDRLAAEALDEVGLIISAGTARIARPNALPNKPQIVSQLANPKTQQSIAPSPLCGSEPLIANVPT